MRNMQRGRRVRVRVSRRVILRCLVLLALNRPGHVQHPDHGVSVVGVVASCHGGDGEALRVRGEAGLGELHPLLEQVVVVRSRRLVIIPRAVVVIYGIVIIVRTAGSSETTLSIDALLNIFVGL